MQLLHKHTDRIPVADGVMYPDRQRQQPFSIPFKEVNDIEKRLKQLNRSETIPFAFRVHATYKVTSRLTDLELHRLIDKLNPDLRAIETFDGKERVKEFNAMSAEDAYGLLECIAKISGTEDRLQCMTPEGYEVLDEQIAEEVREVAKRGPFRFSACGIPAGSELVFIDDDSVCITVVDDRRIQYDGEITQVSALAQRLKGFDHPVQGTLWFPYRGEKLTDIRDRLEAEQE